MELLSNTEIILCIWGTVVSLLCSYYYVLLYGKGGVITADELHRAIVTDADFRDSLRILINRADADRTSQPTGT